MSVSDQWSWNFFILITSSSYLWLLWKFASKSVLSKPVRRPNTINLKVEWSWWIQRAFKKLLEDVQEIYLKFVMSILQKKLFSVPENQPLSVMRYGNIEYWTIEYLHKAPLEVGLKVLSFWDQIDIHKITRVENGQ